MARRHVISARVNDREKQALQNLIGAADTLDFGEWVRSQIHTQANNLGLMPPSALDILSDEEISVSLKLGVDPEDYLRSKRETEKERAEKNRKWQRKVEQAYGKGSGGDDT